MLVCILPSGDICCCLQLVVIIIALGHKPEIPPTYVLLTANMESETYKALGLLLDLLFLLAVMQLAAPLGGHQTAPLSTDPGCPVAALRAKHEHQSHFASPILLLPAPFWCCIRFGVQKVTIPADQAIVNSWGLSTPHNSQHTVNVLVKEAE